MKRIDKTIYLTGFMGVGKSTLGSALARALHRPFVDMDSVLTERFGMPIAEVFATRGEADFRQEETALLEELAQRQRLVVATGGGVPVTDANRALMRRNGCIVLLDADPDRIRDRLSENAIAERPLWQEMDHVRELYQSRAQPYGDNDLAVDAIGLTIEEKVETILASVMPDVDIPVSLDGTPCPVRATVRGPDVLADLAGDRRVVVLTDENVAEHHLERYRQCLGEAVDVIISPGEHSKSLGCAERVYKEMLEARIERGDLLVALGGGVVTDFGAFVAATYKRGMPAALVSTSLLGCVDAAIGGKSAVNLGPYKNQVGLFTVPEQVVLDLTALSTLPEEEIREGLIEGYKTGLALNPDLAAFIESELVALLSGDLPNVAVVARDSAREKARVVTADFREKGLRRVLNLGHTYGHAVETWHEYRIKHGQSVAAGLLLMTELSRGRSMLDDDTADRIVETALRMVTTRFDLPEYEEAWPIMLADKKNVGGKITFVLLDGLGDHTCVNDVQPREFTAAWERMQQVWNG